MARKKKHEEHENHERWLVSYADFITLLFAFFVVMYAISSVNQGKYRVLSDSLVAAFNDPKRSFEPIQIGDLAKSTTNASVEAISKPTIAKVQVAILNKQGSDSGKMTGTGFASSPQSARDIQQIADEVTEALRKLVDMGLVTISVTDLWVEVEIKDSVLFPSGSAEIREEAIAVLTRLAAILADFTNPIRIEGFTDNIPISTRFYPSNWELSGARAASVVRLFERLNIAATRMSAVGYAEHRPIAANDTAEGRAKNRRVVLVVLADKEVEHLLDERLRHSAAPEDVPAVGGHAVTPAPGMKATTPQQITPAQRSEAVKTPAGDAAAAAGSNRDESVSAAIPMKTPSAARAPETAAASVVSPALPASGAAKVKMVPRAAAEKTAKTSGVAASAATKIPRPPNPRPATAVALPVAPVVPVKPVDLGLPVPQSRFQPDMLPESPGTISPNGESGAQAP